MLKKESCTTLIEDVKADYSRGAITVGFCSREERSCSVLNAVRKSRDLLPRNRGWSVDRKLLRDRVLLC